MYNSEVFTNKNRRVTSQLFNLLIAFYTKNGCKQLPSALLIKYLLKKKIIDKPRATQSSLSIISNSPYQYTHDLVSKYASRVNVIKLGEKGKLFEIPLPPTKNSLLIHKLAVALFKEAGTTSPQWRKQLVERLLLIGDELLSSKGKIHSDWKDSYYALKQHRPRTKKRYSAEITKPKVIKNAITKNFQYYI